MAAEGSSRTPSGSPEGPVKWLADENFRSTIVRGLVRRHRILDILRVQDIAAISGKSDPEMLHWATNEGRAVLTHDLSTVLPAMRDY
jgi:hypothetical protein